MGIGQTASFFNSHVCSFVSIRGYLLTPNSPLSPSMGTTKCGGGQENFSKNRSSGKIRGQNRGNS